MEKESICHASVNTRTGILSTYIKLDSVCNLSVPVEGWAVETEQFLEAPGSVSLTDNISEQETLSQTRGK